jgi:CRISPR-associated protein Cas1
MDAHEPPIRVMALHALAYCERLFYLEEVEEIRVANAAVYAGRAEHERLRAGEPPPDARTFDLSSDRLGLVGRVDAVRRHDGVWVPLEIKRGRARREGSTPVAWPTDALQAGAYAMLLEEALGAPVPEAHIRYLADDVTVVVPVTDALRTAVHEAVRRGQELRRRLERPPVTTNDRLCLRCSLAPVCLPEEERLAKDNEWEPVRLFPPGREGRVLHVTDHRWRVGRQGSALVVSADSEQHVYPMHELEAVVIHGHAQITTQALLACAAAGVSVHWVTTGGHYAAGLAVGAGNVHRRLRQYQALSKPETCLQLARRLATAKVENQLRYVLRASRGKERPTTLLARLEQMRSSLRTITGATSPDQIRGGEGAAAQAYFESLPYLLSDRVPPEMRPAGRSRRPPQDRFNALLSFGYSLLYQTVLRSVLVVGLEPAIGFFHTPRSSAHPLVLDLMELFRVPVWDVAVLGSVNRLHWDPAADFNVTRGAVWLSDSGRRKAIALFEQRLQEPWKHPVVRYSLSYERAIELEVRLLEKEWTGHPGLFARARIR